LRLVAPFRQFVAMRWAAREALPRVHSNATTKPLEPNMIDRIFAPFLTFALLIGGTAAVASSLFTEPAAPTPQVAQGAAKAVIVLETVVITAKRQPT
jgi:hypothetical protein